MGDLTRFGVIGLGLMGREFASAIARWSHVETGILQPQITGICSPHDSSHEWFRHHLPGLAVDTDDYRQLLESPDVDAVYIAVPHNLHREIYLAAIEGGKDVMGEKPFGIDLEANRLICASAANRPDVFIRCCSQFPYFPPVQRIVREVSAGAAGRIIEARAGFHHSSDLDPSKPINWKRRVETNGRYGCMGDLGMHVMHVPFRLGWRPRSAFGQLSNLVAERPNSAGVPVPCDTFDNATIHCEATDRDGNVFPLTFEMKRMMPGATNDWFLEIYGMNRSYRYSTSQPRTLFFCDNAGREQGWTRLDMGYSSAVPAITGSIFEFGFSDAILQMWGAYMLERAGDLGDRFGCVTLDETALSHAVMSAAISSSETGRAVEVADGE